MEILKQKHTWLYVGLFTLIGTAILFVASATGPYVSIEPETATLTNGVTTTDDSAVSGGKYIAFKQAVTSSDITHGYQINASNTGITGHGVSESSLIPSGSMTINTPGTVIEGRSFTGQVIINADNVTIRDCKFTTNNPHGAIRINPGADNWKVEWVTISGGRVGSIGFETYQNTTGEAYRLNISGMENGLRMASGTLTESYVHEPISPGGGAHRDGIEIYYGGDILLQRSRIEHDRGETATINITGDFGHVDGVSIIDSHMDGGNGTILIDNKNKENPSNLKFVGNTFGDNYVYDYFLRAGAGYGDSGTSNPAQAGAHKFLWQNNTWAQSAIKHTPGGNVSIP